jgi:folate-dependent phosphoribosylglycinamide formyltransferase PurN
MVGKIRIGALISGSGTNLQAIIEACDDEKIEGRMVFVGSDDPEASGLQRRFCRMILISRKYLRSKLFFRIRMIRPRANFS